MPLISPVSLEITVKRVRWTRLKIDFILPLDLHTKVICYYCNFFHVFHNVIVKVKKTKLLVLLKFGSLKGRTSAFLKIGKILSICNNVASFNKWACKGDCKHDMQAMPWVAHAGVKRQAWLLMPAPLAASHVTLICSWLPTNVLDSSLHSSHRFLSKGETTHSIKTLTNRNLITNYMPCSWWNKDDQLNFM